MIELIGFAQRENRIGPRNGELHTGAQQDVRVYYLP